MAEFGGSRALSLLPGCLEEESVTDVYQYTQLCVHHPNNVKNKYLFLILFVQLRNAIK